jgi:hypothetical protein
MLVAALARAFVFGKDHDRQYTLKLLVTGRMPSGIGPVDKKCLLEIGAPATAESGGSEGTHEMNTREERR